MTLIEYNNLLFDKTAGRVSMQSLPNDAFANFGALDKGIQGTTSTPRQNPGIAILKTTENIQVFLITFAENGLFDNAAHQWLDIDNIDEPTLASLISFLYRRDLSGFLMSNLLDDLRQDVRDYLRRIKLDPDSGGGWPRQSVHPDHRNPNRLVRVGWNAKGQPYHRSIGVIGTSLGILTSLLAGIESTDVVVQDSIQTLRLLQNEDGGWATNDTDPISVLPSTSYALWALHEAGLGADTEAVHRGLANIYDAQHKTGGWGLCKHASRASVFNTCRALQVLLMYGERGSQIEHGLAWLQEAQNIDFGWSFYSSKDVSGQESTPAHSAYALQTLAQYGLADEIPAARAREWLLRQGKDGTWREISETGVAMDDKGQERDWWYSHKSSPWSLYALLLSNKERLLTADTLPGILAALNELKEVISASKGKSATHVPLWRIHDNLLVLTSYARLLSALGTDLYLFWAEKFTRLNTPYIVGRPVRERELLVGRDRELEYLRSQFTREGPGAAVNLHGQRRTGKTSLLFAMANEFIASGYIPVHWDQQRYTKTTETTARVLWDLATLIQQAANQIADAGLPQPQFNEFEHSPTIEFLNYLNRVEKTLGNRKLLILCDEFERLDVLVEQGQVDDSIYSFIRHLLMTRDMMSFVFSGTHRIDTGFSKHWSVLLGSVLPIGVGYLDAEAVHRLIVAYPETKGVPVAFTPGAIERITDLSGGQPYVCQDICFWLIQYLNDFAKRNYVTRGDVDHPEVINRALESLHMHFRSLVAEECTTDEQRVLKALAEFQAPMNLAQLASASALPLHDLQVQIEQLEAKDLIRITKLGYDFRIGLLRKWLVSDKGPEKPPTLVHSDRNEEA